MNFVKLQPFLFSIRAIVFKFLIFSLGIFFSIFLKGQSAEIILKPDSIAPGEQSEILLQVLAVDDQTIIFPVLSDTITENIEILSYGKQDTLITENGIWINRRYMVTSWKDGFFAIPPISLMAVNDGDTIKFETNAGLLEVSPVEVDMAEGIRDIRPIFKIPVSFEELLPYIIGLVVLVVLVFFFVRYFKKRKKVESIGEIWQKPEIPAHVAAISSLEKLKNQKLWRDGKVKVFHTELTMVMRLYLEKRFHIDAPEMTSSEIIMALRSRVENRDMINILRGILEQADLVKFAKHLPEDIENESAVERAIEFVKYHIPSSEDQQNKKGA